MEKSQKGGEPILELICKGLIKWLSTLFLEAAAYFINQLLGIFGGFGVFQTAHSGV